MTSILEVGAPTQSLRDRAEAATAARAEVAQYASLVVARRGSAIKADGEFKASANDVQRLTDIWLAENGLRPCSPEERARLVAGAVTEELRTTGGVIRVPLFEGLVKNLLGLRR